MTETVVALVVNELVQLIVHESNLLKGVHQEVVDIKDELESIQSFLKDVDKGDLQAGVKMWVKQVREAAYHIEDVIDEYVLHMAQRRYQQSFLAFLNKIGRLLKYIKPRHDIATKIQDIKILVREIKERSERYGFSSSEQGSSNNAANVACHDPRVGALFIEEDEVVGIESTKDELISWLVGEASKHSVMSVVGMGGIGNTTLAKKVYENESVKGHFDCRVWITVSQSYNVQKILMSMIDQIYQAKETALEQIDMTDEITLITQLRKFYNKRAICRLFREKCGFKYQSIGFESPEIFSAPPVLSGTTIPLSLTVFYLLLEFFSGSLYRLKARKPTVTKPPHIVTSELPRALTRRPKMAQNEILHHVQTVLDGTNYMLWSQSMRSFLKDRKPWLYATGEIQKPVKRDSEADEAFTTRLIDWDSKHHQILTWFRNTTIPSISTLFGNFDEESGQSINDFLARMQFLWNQIDVYDPIWKDPTDAEMHVARRDQHRLHQFLMALHDDFEPVRVQLLHRSPLPTLDTAIFELVHAETRS
ncbi:uncharacterized protein LOC132169237 [Corylus avellana]|uniref:uncharacterized protein LOC132169237 n=1 Tax=Corylus avellana TaxID=13451 RepID=UPI00286D609C|nr:uncharacterized protein LOC132169237 [Corylus avellana]